MDNSLKRKYDEFFYECVINNYSIYQKNNSLKRKYDEFLYECVINNDSIYQKNNYYKGTVQ